MLNDHNENHCNQMLNTYFLTSDPTRFMSHMQSSLQKPGVISIQNVGWNSQSTIFFQSLAISDKHINPHNKWNRSLVSCAKTAEAIDTTKPEGGLFCFLGKLCTYSFVLCGCWLNEVNLILYYCIVIWFLTFITVVL